MRVNAEAYQERRRARYRSDAEYRAPRIADATIYHWLHRAERLERMLADYRLRAALRDGEALLARQREAEVTRGWRA